MAHATLPITTWGAWANYPGALAWSATTYAPPPLANGGLYTSPQSTGEWASKPMPATQYAFALEAAHISHTPEVFYHQRPNDNSGASYSPIVGSPASPLHTSMTQGPMIIAPNDETNIAGVNKGMSTSFVFDTRLPVSPNLPASDPSHPKNVLRNALIVQNQAAADTKYDIYPPTRVEAFSYNQLGLSKLHTLLVALLVAVVCVMILLRVQNLVIRIAFIALAIYSLHYVTSRLQV
jgi:hypothetical protein